MSGQPDDVFYAHVTRELLKGRLTPFLGAGVNLVGIDWAVAFQPGARFPSGAELATQLAREYSFPGDPQDLDLVRVSQWVVSRLGSETLYEYLHDVFDHDFPFTSAHEVLARTPEFIRGHGLTEFPLVVTTNYDDALERALAARGEPYDVLTYIANADDRGLFRHTDANGVTQVIRAANRYRGVTLTERPAILKLHGAVLRPAVSVPIEDDSYVVTEDDYMECLTRTDLVGYLPPAVARRMQGCHYLFLGYSLRDWNLRAMMHRIWRDRAKQNRAWAIVTTPDPLEVEAWRSRDVEMFDLDVADFAGRLATEMDTAILKMQPR